MMTMTIMNNNNEYKKKWWCCSHFNVFMCLKNETIALKNSVCIVYMLSTFIISKYIVHKMLCFGHIYLAKKKKSFSYGKMTRWQESFSALKFISFKHARSVEITECFISQHHHHPFLVSINFPCTNLILCISSLYNIFRY